MNRFLGIDIGTFESKGVIADETGRILAEARRPHRMLTPLPGWAEHRAEEDWWGDFCGIARELLERTGLDPKRIAGIGTSGIGPCMLPLAEDGTPLMNAVLYGVDTRAAREIGELTARIGADVLLERCGTALSSQSVGPKVLWLARNRPDLWARTAHVTTCQSFLVLRLTGEHVVDHYSAASFHPFYDVNRLDWAADLCAGIVEPEKLPRPVWTTEIAGKVTAAAARATGLAEGTPVIAGTIDAAAEAASVGVRAPGDLMLMMGSSTFIIEVTAARVRDPRLYYAPWLFAGRHAAMAGLSTSGTLTQWFRETFAPGEDRAAAFAALAAEAEASPRGAKGLICLPYFSGERTPIDDPRARGVLFGLNLTHGRGDLFRAALEGIALATRHVFETYAEAGAAPARVVAVGGGTKNAVWSGAVAEATGLAQEVCTTSIGAAYGDAFLAAVGMGAAREDDIAAWNPVARVVPAGSPGLYDAPYAIFRELYRRTKDLMARLPDGG